MNNAHEIDLTEIDERDIALIKRQQEPHIAAELGIAPSRLDGDEPEQDFNLELDDGEELDFER